MRLKVLETGQAGFTRLKFYVIGKLARMRVPDVVRVLEYRREFFGKPFSDLVEKSLRNSDHWSHGECELFAAFVSSRNQCPF